MEQNIMESTKKSRKIIKFWWLCFMVSKGQYITLREIY
jgi:hypothetical protein